MLHGHGNTHDTKTERKMRAELMRSAIAGRFTLILEGDSADITVFLAVVRAGGDAPLVDLLGEKAAANPAHVQLARKCLAELFGELIQVAEKFNQYLKQK